MNIGGNKTIAIQVCGAGGNEIGEDAPAWEEALVLRGWLDLLAGDSNSTKFNAKMQESTHVFLCDYSPLLFNSGEGSGGQAKITPENSRIVIGGEVYEVKLYDDPMGLHEHLEIFLKYVGG